MSYSQETIQYLLQRFHSLKDNKAFAEADARVDRFASEDKDPSREELLQFSEDLITIADIIRILVQDCDSVEEQMQEQRYLRTLPEDLKAQMEEVAARINQMLTTRFLHSPIRHASLVEIRHLAESEIQQARACLPFNNQDVDFLRKRLFGNLTLNGYKFTELEGDPNHPLFRGR